MKTALRWVEYGLLGVFAVGLAACTEDVDSTDVRTSGVYADMEVLATGNGQSEVTVGLKVGGTNSNTFLELDGEDELVASADGQNRNLTERGNYYEATFDTDAGGTEFKVAFNRGPEDTDAPDSHVTLPAPFELAGLDQGQTVSRADGFTLTWETSPDDDDMRWELDGDCLFHESDGISDTGTVTISASDFDPHSGDEDTTCNARICVERSRRGSVDSAFGEGGVIEAIQRRCVSFESAP